MQRVSRPTSPHLTIYRKQISSVMSILHRITGIILSAGTLLIAAFLLVLAYCPYNYEAFRYIISSPVGLLIIFGWTVAFYYHLFNGIRHLYWDMGKGFELQNVNKSGVLAFILTILCSVGTWFIALQNIAAQNIGGM